MGRVTRSLRGRLVIMVLAIQAVLAPVLYIGVAAIIQSGYADLFVDDVRTYSRILADELEISPVENFDEHAQHLLDGVVLTGHVVYAELSDGTTSIRSSLAGATLQDSYPGEDFVFGGHGDQVYYLSHPINRPGRPMHLRIGFDESPSWQQIANAKQRLLTAIILFALSSIAAAIWLSVTITRPMLRLQQAAERIARGDSATTLQMSSSLSEVQELNRHLESMRQKLVGTNQQLQREIEERQALELEHLELERRMLHRERIVTIGTLAGGIAHELNNIMTPILLYSQLVLKELPDDSAVAEDLRRVVRSAHRARSLVSRVLTFSRTIRSQEQSVLSLRPILDEALLLLRAIVPANVDIVDLSVGEPPTVRGDSGQVHQVLMALSTNAYQSMRRSGGVLSLKIQNVGDPGDQNVPPGRYAMLQVRDSGHGMEPSVMAHIFEPFFTTREVGDGTGLGLSVVHGIVTSMGGIISVESVVGQGTTFSVYFPQAQITAESTAEAAGANVVPVKGTRIANR
jgi:signal transduction histidine kinase